MDVLLKWCCQPTVQAAVKSLVEEFLLGGGAREAARSLLELRAPQYHHEFVKRAVVLAMDRKMAEQEAVSGLFLFLFNHEVRPSHCRVAYAVAPTCVSLVVGE